MFINDNFLPLLSYSRSIKKNDLRNKLPRKITWSCSIHYRQYLQNKSQTSVIPRVSPGSVFLMWSIYWFTTDLLLYDRRVVFSFLLMCLNSWTKLYIKQRYYIWRNVLLVKGLEYLTNLTGNQSLKYNL